MPVMVDLCVFLDIFTRDAQTDTEGLAAAGFFYWSPCRRRGVGFGHPRRKAISGVFSRPEADLSLTSSVRQQNRVSEYVQYRPH
jgi:hypothetical protein